MKLLALIVILPFTSRQPMVTRSDVKFPEIRITISKGQYAALLETTGQKMVLRDPEMTVNGESLKPKEIRSRGNNSLRFEHKSLSIDLAEKVTLKVGNPEVSIRKFDLLNLVMDKNLWHNRWAFQAMADLGIFPLYNSYCTLWINNQPQGIYLLVEKPHHYTEHAKSPYTLRRGPDHSIDAEYVDTPSKEDGKKYRKRYQSLYSGLSGSKGEELYKNIDATLLSDRYFIWLAFNYLIMNGDYADEVFLYIDPATDKFNVLPWDYDDILRAAPHEGMTARNSASGLRDRLIFSSEDALDRAIGTDDFVYEKYLAAFRRVFDQLSEEKLQQFFSRVTTELQAVSMDPAIAEASRYVGKDSFVMTRAANEIAIGQDFIVKRRTALLSKLK